MKLMLVAGEASGDNLGGALLAHLRSRVPDLQAFGVGGQRMQAHGLTSVAEMNELSVIGVAEVVRRLPRLVRIFRQLVSLLALERPDALITIDLPDFNFMLARRARALGIRVIHYVSPQVWAWRSSRVHDMARWVDHLLVLFPFEPACYQGTGLAVDFVGHPLVAATRLTVSRQAWRQRYGVGDGERLVVVLPGSRHSEIRQLLAVMVKACGILAQDGQLRFALALADTLTEDDLRPYWPAEVAARITLWQGETYGLLAAADAAMVASGTATLEAALLGAPMTLAYRVHPWSYWLGRRVIRTPWIGLVNIVAGRTLVPERIQQEANPARLAADVRGLLDDPVQVQAMKEGFEQIRQQLAEPAQGAGEVVLRILGEH